MPRVRIDTIVIDEAIYPRNSISQLHVERLAAALSLGQHLPPLVVEAGSRRLVDGFHRRLAHLKNGATHVNVVEKVYATEADLFADAVRLNVVHGEPLSQYSVKCAIIRLSDYGFTRDQISDVIRLPIAQIEKLERGFARDAVSGRPLALKGGLAHLARTTITPGQQQVNRRYSGPKATFYVRQTIDLLRNNMYPTTTAFADSMDELCALWQMIRSTAAAAE